MLFIDLELSSYDMNRYSKEEGISLSEFQHRNFTYLLRWGFLLILFVADVRLWFWSIEIKWCAYPFLFPLFGKFLFNHVGKHPSFVWRHVRCLVLSKYVDCEINVPPFNAKIQCLHQRILSYFLGPPSDYTVMACAKWQSSALLERIDCKWLGNFHSR